jgi:hypothetical protein
VLATRWEEKELQAVSQTYRDGADTENMFDELASMSAWLGAFRDSTAQLARQARWPALLRRIFRHFFPASSPATAQTALPAAADRRIWDRMS